jgi:DNA-binding transcriptional regulator YiaG
MDNPKPEDIKAARQAAGLTQTQAGALVHTTVRVWQQWEAGDRAMHPAFWELFLLKAKEKK